ncbi:hypothetical protein EV385_5301 [Krasilnikovia cinnamomea]|uniref:AMIN-like domain-containing protein n=2 Tax=Krasilnikovia cinnamomea TaxID=349313 RepID=A0A4Q7ZQI0_9ACTN|nr:hypothetical protein EV385_5301 [Krasilnikovia cinnamomea]
MIFPAALVLFASFGGVSAANADVATAQQSTLVDIRAANHTTYDRLVFEFRGPLPQERDVRFVSQIIEDGSGAPVPMIGDAVLQVRFFPAVGHDDAGNGTFGPLRRTFALPNLMQVNSAGDFEAVLRFGVSLAQAKPFRVSTLTNPSRLVIDIDTPAQTVPVQVFFIDNANQQRPRAVSRPVIPPATSRGALQRMFAGPTQQEAAGGLVFVDSGAGNFATVWITDQVARVQLTDDCDSRGSTTTIANEIMPTLKQFSTVDWVKILDPNGNTEEPEGRSDSIPFCLEP